MCSSLFASVQLVEAKWIQCQYRFVSSLIHIAGSGRQSSRHAHHDSCMSLPWSFHPGCLAVAGLCNALQQGVLLVMNCVWRLTPAHDGAAEPASVLHQTLLTSPPSCVQGWSGCLGAPWQPAVRAAVLHYSEPVSCPFARRLTCGSFAVSSSCHCKLLKRHHLCTCVVCTVPLCHQCAFWCTAHLSQQSFCICRPADLERVSSASLPCACMLL